MAETIYRGRRAQVLENDNLEVVVTVEGGHIAAFKDKGTQLNPLWSPPWTSIEPSRYDPEKHPEYGAGAESKLLAGLLGHNLCLDIFGGPSAAEAAAGMTVHGEASVALYDVEVSGDTLTQATILKEAQLSFRRQIQLPSRGRVARIKETVENVSALDRPIAWTQHVTLGPPFLEKGQTQFEATATRSKVIEHDFTDGKGYMKVGAEFEWPTVPCIDGRAEDLRVFTTRAVSGGFCTHLMDPSRNEAWFVAWSPTRKLAFGCIWKRQDFPWLGIWEENRSRIQSPWNGQTLTRGMEFGVSPFPETRQAMLERGTLFGAPTCRWIPARQSCTAEYKIFLIPAERMPDERTLAQL
jgi:hypothetical protein